MLAYKIEVFGALILRSFPKWLVLGGAVSEPINMIILLVKMIGFYLYIF